MKKLPSNIEKWVKALRSGKYEQAQDCLYNPEVNGYCCLGVYLKVVSKESKHNLNPNKDPSYPGSAEYYARTEKVLGKALQEDLVEMNDNGYSFLDIADVIENKFWEYQNVR